MRLTLDKFVKQMKHMKQMELEHSTRQEEMMTWCEKKIQETRFNEEIQKIKWGPPELYRKREL